MNRKKHECSLLEVFSDVGSTPTASTIFSLTTYFFGWRIGVFYRVFEKSGLFPDGFLWSVGGVFVVLRRTLFFAENFPFFTKIFFHRPAGVR
jgi:hypothetical protein